MRMEHVGRACRRATPKIRNEQDWVGRVLGLIGLVLAVEAGDPARFLLGAAASAAKTTALPPLQVDKNAPLLLDELPEPSDTPTPAVGRPSPANNTSCYVCHLNYKEEPFARWHTEAGVGCAQCHGESREHAADEANTTPPTVMYWPSKIDPSCARCHNYHNAPAQTVLARWQERSSGKTDSAAAVCTDCHGEHRLKLRTIIWDKQSRVLLVKHKPTFTQADAGQARPRPTQTGLFARTNLLAWCIVPFDERKRGPEERAAMLEWLGFRMFAYDYRPEHIPTFDTEMEKLKQYHVRLLAWWFPNTLNDEARLILDVLKRHSLRDVQLWVSGGGSLPPNTEQQKALLEAEAERIRPIADAAAKQSCTVGLYNHGGWFGEPENQIAIIHRLQQVGLTNVGIVYNLHHGHDHLGRFPELMRQMKPHLLALNLNGMTPNGDKTGKKILPLGQGDLDLELLRIIRDSGWRGPIGLLNHTDEDAEARLRDNLDGLDWLVAQLESRTAGPRPTPSTWPPSGSRPSPPTPTPRGQASLSPAFGHALSGGLVAIGQPAYRALPVTVECWAKLNSRQGFNILVACDTKDSAEHWELYSYAGSGAFSVYQPGRGGEFKSEVNICDGQWHYLAAILESERVRLFVDDKLALDAPAKPVRGLPRPGGIAFGRLVEGGIGCDGWVDDVRISSGTRAIAGQPKQPLAKDPQTVGLWNFDDLLPSR
jgi:sugar phosphate isomerase/epimerase